MPRLLSLLLIASLALATLLAATPVAAQTIPKPVGHLNDLAGVVDPSVEPEFENALRLFQEETTVEIAVVTLPSHRGYSLENYAVRLFESWGIGKKGVDNGILLLFSLEEREVRIEVGYGMEPYLTDGRAGSILDTEILPDLRAGNYGLGLLKGARAIAQTIQDSDYQPGAVRDRPFGEEVVNRFGGKLWVLFILGAASLYMVAYITRTREVILGAVWGAAAGGILGWIAGGILAIVLGIVISAIAGLLLDILLSRAYLSQSKGGGPTSWYRTWGGFGNMGRGGYGGYGGSGKSFGGFGGGRSGGGGASRRF